MSPEPKVSFWRKQVIEPALDRDAEAAVREQQAILRRNPRDAKAHFALGELCHLRGETGPAMDFYIRAIELDATYAAPHSSLGRIYAVRGDYDLAWQHAREAERLGDRSLVEQLERYPKLK
jgi:Flp pilus assembly protein TadD